MKRARKKQAETPEKISAKPKASKKVSKKGKKRKKGSKIAIAAVIVIFALVFIALGLGGGGDNALIPIDDSTGKMNVLLLGVDEEGLRTDAIMIASYDFDDESLKLLSVPRDTKMYVTNRKKTRKINEIHAMSKKGGGIMGPLGSIEAVTAITNIPINYYVEFSFDAIDEIADILGPVTFDVPDIEGGGKGMNYDDPTQDLHIHLKPGVQEISGNQYQQLLRYRKSNNEKIDGSDTSRVQRQQEFVKAILEQKVNMSLIVKAHDIYAKVKKNIKTNFSAGEIAKYATHLLKLSSDKVTTFSLPGADKHSTAWYFECDFDAAKTLIETEFGYDASNITNRVEITGEKLKTPGKVNSEKPSSEDKTSGKSETSKTEKPKASEPTKTKAPADEEKEETPSAKPTHKATPKPTEKPQEAEEETPKKTVEPARPTPNTSEADDVIDLE